MPGIIVGIDGSADSARALEWAVHEAAVRQAPLTVLTIYQLRVSSWAAPVSYPQDPAHVERARIMAQEATGKALAQLSGDSPPAVAVRALSGTPADELLRAAQDADMIVVGSRGAGGFRRLLMGSVSTMIAWHARCPVVVIPGEDR